MATQTKVNPNPIARGTLYSTLQLKAFKVVPTTALVSTTLADTSTRLAEEFGTTAALFQIKSDGTSMIIIGDGHALDADIVDVRATAVLGESVTVTELTSLYGLA